MFIVADVVQTHNNKWNYILLSEIEGCKSHPKEAP